MAGKRLAEELNAVGLPCKGLRNGIPLYTKKLDAYEANLAQAVVSSHIEEDERYAAADLTRDATNVMNMLGAESAEWTAYRNLQEVYQVHVTKMPLRAVRFLDALADGKDLAEIQSMVRSLRTSATST